MKRARHHCPVDPYPPAGAIEMTYHLFEEDPVQFRAYASFTARVDAYQSKRGHQGWGSLNVRRFIGRLAATPAEAGVMCCMLAKLLPWMVCAGDITRDEAREKFAVLKEVCPKDPTARASVAAARAQLDETEASLLGAWLH